MEKIILAINPGSTSTKIALFKNAVKSASEDVRHDAAAMRKFPACIDQRGMRLECVLNTLAKFGVKPADLAAASGRGGPIRPVPGGTYRVNDALLEEIMNRSVIDHPSLLGGLLVHDIAAPAGKPAFIVDPVSVDELEPISRISGLKEFPRKSLGHFLNKRAAARRYAAKIGKPYEELRLVVCHMGGGISMSAHKNGRMIDTLDSNGEGPFTPERSGCIRVDDLASFAFQKGMTEKRLKDILTKEGGLMSRLGTFDAVEVERRIAAGDADARLVYEAMALQISKAIAALACSLSGKIDAILITGALAKSAMLTGWIKNRVAWAAPVEILPGEFEMEALAEGALRVLDGIEKPRIFPSCEFEE